MAKRKPAARKKTAARKSASTRSRTGSARSAKRSRKAGAGRGRGKAAAGSARKATTSRTAKNRTSRTAKKKTAKKAAKTGGRTVRSSAKRPAPRAGTARTRTAPGSRRTPSPRTSAPPEQHGAPSSLDFDRAASAARTGRDELVERLNLHTETGPQLTGGDLDANWETAYSSGDEAPGGDNPTPDQDVVEEIGRALGVDYQDNEELRSSDKIVDRDRHRWELDPASAEDYQERARRPPRGEE